MLGTSDFQLALQQRLALVALICVPVMLFARPMMLLFASKRRRSQEAHAQSTNLDRDPEMSPSLACDNTVSDMSPRLEKKSSDSGSGFSKEDTEDEDKEGLLAKHNIATCSRGELSNSDSYQMRVGSSKKIVLDGNEISFKKKVSVYSHTEKEPDFNFGEEMIDQGIETIEFVLGEILQFIIYDY